MAGGDVKDKEGDGQLNPSEFSNLFKQREERESLAEQHRTYSAILRENDDTGPEEVGYIVPLSCGHRGMFLEREKLYIDKLIE